MYSVVLRSLFSWVFGEVDFGGDSVRVVGLE